MTDRTEIDAARDLLADLGGVQVAFVQDPRRELPPDIPVIMLPGGPGRGMQAVSAKKFLDEYRVQPEHRTGTALFTKLDSFIGHVNRYKTLDRTVLFADVNQTTPQIVAVLDYNAAGPTLATGSTDGSADIENGFMRHCGVYRPKISQQWKTWIIDAKARKDNDREWMSQGDFAAFIEDNILDALPIPILDQNSAADQKTMAAIALLGGTIGSPDKLMELSRGLSIGENSVLNTQLNITTGETMVQFASEHRDQAGAKLVVPGLFFIGIPVFEAEAVYRIMVRLRYRKQGAAVVWSYEPYRAVDVFLDSFTEACEKAREQAMVPLFYGTPEARPA
jgi:hypothetical protein